MKNTLERFQMLMKLHRHTRWLIFSKKPVKERLAIWQKDFDKLCKEFAKHGMLK